MIRFLAEISKRSEIEIHTTPIVKIIDSNTIKREINIYELNIDTYPKNTYWTDWGGYYDNFTGTQIELYYSQFLQHVNSFTELFNTSFSLYLSDNIVYLNVPLHPWLYPNYTVEAEEVIPFLSAPLDPDNPSNNNIRGINAKVLLEKPNFTYKLSENISGSVLNQGFTLNFTNNNGEFDDDNTWDLFNTPVTLKKATVENPSYGDFKTIRRGLADSTKTTFENFHIEVSDRLRALNEPVCNTIQQADFPSLTILPAAIGKNIPVIYGTKKIDLIKISSIPEAYFGSEFISAMVVYDNNGNIIPYTLEPNGIIYATNAKSANITGYTQNNIGQIIKDIVTRKTSIQYNDSGWNELEVTKYINIAPKINIAFTSGDVRGVIQNALKSDMAYFIQQMDGRFTLRRFGEIYNTYAKDSWLVTQRPDKDYSHAQQNYFSSCVINYNHTDKDTYLSLMFSEMENIAESRYRKRLRRTFDTDLINEADAYALASMLGARFTTLKQTLRLPVGFDTSEVELLDIVEMEQTINNREFSAEGLWVIAEINPAQDILMLESITTSHLIKLYLDG